MKKPVSTIIAMFLFLVAFLHVLRLVFQVPVIVGETNIPMWASIFGALVPGVLAVLLKKECGGE